MNIEPLMRGMIRDMNRQAAERLPPAERDAALADLDRREADEALIDRLNRSPARGWWLLASFIVANRAERIASGDLVALFDRTPYDGSDIFDRVVRPADELVDLYRQLAPERRKVVWRRWMAAEAVLPAIDVEVVDLATGEMRLPASAGEPAR